MGNCNCLERARAKVTAWGGEGDDGEDEYWGATAAEFSCGAQGVLLARKGKYGEDGGGGTTSSPTRRVKIRMTKGQLRRLLDGAGRESAVEDVVAEIMSMGEVHVEPVKAEDHQPPSSKLETIQEDIDE
ncbi:hypothetical protein E2562_003866 [Oryza meyeriana var. granulata]|uniref:Uncharacterized protein n=1 Tax=Oryza meyeriana var. granulata TaxID=110450 RepID=A0A6G1CXC8_9ORYZ|nr:hypothetical protein E2562_003866 [Oryza meyeriana var. granulata]